MLDRSSSIQPCRCGPMIPPGVDAALAAAMEDNARLRAELLRLHASGRLFKSIIDNAPLLISTKDLQGNILTANKHFSTLAGYEEANFVGKNIFAIFPEAIATALWANEQRAVTERRPVHEEETFYHRDRSAHTYATVKFPLLDDKGAVTGTCAVSTDITAAKLAERDSVTDALTGLKNARSLNLRFVEEQRSAHRGGRSLTLLLADVDRFNIYNERHGQAQGDVVLIAMARAISATLNRSHDLTFRIGGAAFACLFSTTAEAESLTLAEQIRKRLLAQELEHPANPPHAKVTLSGGITFLHPGKEVTLAEAYAQAGAALLRAKHNGRNTISR